MRIGPFDHPQLDLMVVLHQIGVAVGSGCGLLLGLKYFGWVGAVAGSFIGFFVGHVIGAFPDRLAYRSLFNEIDGSSDSELKEMLTRGEWRFGHTLALLHLAARGHDVQPELPRVLSMLESDSRLTRVYGLDALRVVYTELAVKIPDYDPNESTEICRHKVARLRERETG